MFRGATTINLDAKGRLAMPTKHRDALQVQCGGDLVLTAHPHGCLLMYPQPAWEPIQAKMMALSSFNRQASDLQRLLVGNADDVALDNAGRVLIPPSLRELAKLDKEVKLVGQGSHFELWSIEAWRAQLERVMSEQEMVVPAELEGFSL